MVLLLSTAHIHSGLHSCLQTPKTKTPFLKLTPSNTREGKQGLGAVVRKMQSSRESHQVPKSKAPAVLKTLWRGDRLTDKVQTRGLTPILVIYYKILGLVFCFVLFLSS